jgi:hypothetical protein
MVTFGLTLSFLGLCISLLSFYLARKGQFYSDTHFLIPLGIFIWGDGLIFGPFWVISGLLFTQLASVFVVRYLLLFWVVRSGYEVAYWITHQAVASTYEPPLFRRVTWLNANQSAILYQLLNTLGLFFSLFGLLLSFSF